MRLKAKQLVCFELIYALFIMQWLTYFGISNIKVLIPDAINLFLLVVFGKKLWNNACDCSFRKITGITFLFLFITFTTSILGEMFSGGIKNVILAFWDIRIIIRPIFFFLCVYTFLTKEDLDRIFSILYKLQFLNVALSLFQYYIQGYWMDVNGGIFAPVQGCNKYSNVFCCIMLMWTLARFIRGTGKLYQVIITFACTIIVAIYSELKFLFIEMIAIALLSIFFSGSGKKTIRLLIVGALISYFGLYLLSVLFPESFEILTNSDLFMWYAKDMSYSNTAVSVNRLSGFEIVNQYMFDNDFLKRLFGFGWGATGQIPFLGIYSTVSLMFSSLNYIAFTYSWLYVEVGIVGLTLFYILLVTIMLCIRKNMPTKKDTSGYGVFSKTAVILTIILTIYDSSWVTEGTTFLCTFCMASGLVASKGTNYDIKKG